MDAALAPSSDEPTGPPPEAAAAAGLPVPVEPLAPPPAAGPGPDNGFTDDPGSLGAEAAVDQAWLTQKFTLTIMGRRVSASAARALIIGLCAPSPALPTHSPQQTYAHLPLVRLGANAQRGEPRGHDRGGRCAVACR